MSALCGGETLVRVDVDGAEIVEFLHFGCRKGAIVDADVVDVGIGPLTATLSIGSDGEICPGSAEQCARCCCRAVNRSVHVTYKSVYRVIGADYVVPSACTERMRAATFLGHRYKLKRVQAFIEPDTAELVFSYRVWALRDDASCELSAAPMR